MPLLNYHTAFKTFFLLFETRSFFKLCSSYLTESQATESTESTQVESTESRLSAVVEREHSPLQAVRPIAKTAIIKKIVFFILSFFSFNYYYYLMCYLISVQRYTFIF